jgi:hypothetical protein
MAESNSNFVWLSSTFIQTAQGGIINPPNSFIHVSNVAADKSVARTKDDFIFVRKEES